MRRRTILLHFVVAVHGLVYAADPSTSPRIRGNVTSPGYAQPRRRWLTQIFAEAQENFRMDSTVNARCASDFHTYKVHLRNQTMWALRMAESAEWPSRAIMSATVDYPGNWEECLMVASEKVTGQYCRVYGVYDFEPNPASVYGTSARYHADEEASAWDTVKMYDRNFNRLSRRKLVWTMCIPSTCTHNELKRSLDRILQPLFDENQVTISVHVNPTMCSTKQAPPKFTAGFYLVSALITTFTVIALVTGLYEYIRNEEYQPKNGADSYAKILFEDFSWVRGYRRLRRVSSSGDLCVLHIMNVVYMVIIILGHRMLFSFQVPVFNVEHSELNDYPVSLKLTTMNAVDAFFFISGVLTYYRGFEPAKKVGGFVTVIGVVARWMRMVPVLSIIQLFVIHVLPCLSEGPNWNRLVQLEVDNCKASFWANFFSLSNILSADKQCLMISWYVSVDIQLTVIGCVLLIGMAKSEKIGFCLTAIAFLGASALTFAVVYLKRYNGLLLLTFQFLLDPRNSEEFNYFYIAFYPRLLPYIVGFLTACLAKHLIACGFKFSNIQIIVLAVVGSCIKLAVMMYGFRFYRIEIPYSPIENGIYAAVNRWVSVVFDAVCVVVMSTTGLAPLNRIFNSVLVVSLSRLTYSVFLTNTIVQFIQSASQRARIDSSYFVNQCWWVMADIMYTYILGLLFYLFLENPISNVSKRILKILFSSAAEKSDLKVQQSEVNEIAEPPVKANEKPDDGK